MFTLLSLSAKLWAMGSELPGETCCTALLHRWRPASRSPHKTPGRCTDHSCPPLRSRWQPGPGCCLTIQRPVEVSVSRIRNFWPCSDLDPKPKRYFSFKKSVLRIRNILEWIRICGAVLLTYGSVLGSCSFRQGPSKFCLLGYYFLKVHLHHSSKLKSHKKCHKTVEIKVLILFAGWRKDPDPDQ